MDKLVYQYDGSWEGLLTSIFEAFERKEKLTQISSFSSQQLFQQNRKIVSCPKKASRVVKRIRRDSELTFKRLVKAFLSEKPDREMLIFRIVQLLLKDKQRVEKDYGINSVLRLKQIEKEMFREVHRMHAFVRFQKGKDDLWYAFIRPDFNVLPLLPNHFKNRYADQKWMIYDLSRKYGIFYNLETIEFVSVDFFDKIESGKLPEQAMDKEEAFYQNLWKDYFQSANITERNNHKLHLRHVPKRYWQLLTEKQ